jgi:inositol monophosphatase
MIEYDFENKIKKLLRSTRKFFKNDNKLIEYKSTHNYVTNIDYKIQNYLCNKIELLSKVRILSEENELSHTISNNKYWILDPVDGTTNLIHNYNYSSISLALCDDFNITMSYIYNPFLDELFYAKKGGGAYMNNKPILCSKTINKQDYLVSIGTSPYNRSNTDHDFQIFKDVFMECDDIRRSGSAALDLANVACGRIELFLERNLKLWDYAAGILLIEEAGGCISNWDGNDINLSFLNSSILASNKIHHNEFINIINKPV